MSGATLGYGVSLGDPQNYDNSNNDARLTSLETAITFVAKYVSASQMLVADLLTNFPASAPYLGQYARVSDYAGYVNRVVRCDYDSGLNLYFWNPTQAEYARSIPLVGDMTFGALTSPTSIILTGTIGLGVTRNVTFNLTNARPGQIWEVKANMTTLLGSLNILGTGLGTGIGILLGNYQKYVVDGSSGTLQLVRMV